MHELPLITTIAAAFTAAWVLGLLTQWLRLSPIVGYLLGGMLIGPHTPGFVADVGLAQQLAEVGVILLMFGVGLHFNLKDLLAVRDVAIPGAIGQSLVATLLGMAMAVGFGWPMRSGIVLGMAMAVASTVVLIRVLTDHKLLETTSGHVAVGWLVVEDIFTVIVLVLIPAMGTPAAGAPAGAAAHAAPSLWIALPFALLKLSVLIVLLLWGGSKVIPWVMVKVAQLRSRELFTLTVLVMAVAIAAASAELFGASMALGAFLAGMVVGQSPVSHQAAADALPLRDAFSVLFFAAVGMLFDPMILVHSPALTLAGLGIVMVGKPLAALVLVAIIGYPPRTALVVALGLAQIGEFSFILAQVGTAHGLLDQAEYNLVVACAIISIAVNPMLFYLLDPLEKLLARWPALWRFMNRKAAERTGKMNEHAGELLARSEAPLAVIVGYGPVGRAVDDLLRTGGLETVVVDLNMETVQALTRNGRAAIYGDAFNIEVMHQALPRATHLVITLPHHSPQRNPLITAAKLINPAIRVFVRARYLSEHDELNQVGADQAVYEEAEAAVALARALLADRGADAQAIRTETLRLRRRFRAEPNT